MSKGSPKLDLLREMRERKYAAAEQRSAIERKAKKGKRERKSRPEVADEISAAPAKRKRT